MGTLLCLLKANTDVGFENGITKYGFHTWWSFAKHNPSRIFT